MTCHMDVIYLSDYCKLYSLVSVTDNVDSVVFELAGSSLVTVLEDSVTMCSNKTGYLNVCSFFR